VSQTKSTANIYNSFKSITNVNNSSNKQEDSIWGGQSALSRSQSHSIVGIGRQMQSAMPI